ncbi:MAG TPA: PEP-CTERM sorting domain-containing protein [Albitalea sp.]|nr:PEP-CTERM sorting domain-containing protein [Albitalea sp.]
MKSKQALCALSLALCAGASHAALTAFTSRSAFDAAISGLAAVQTEDFEGLSAGTTFASGAGANGLTYSYAIPGYSLQVSDTFGTTSGVNYLGLDNPDTAFYLGDSFTIGFGRTVQAVGLYLITGSDAQAGDLQLSVASGSVFNSATPDTLVSDGQAFFLGLVESDPGQGFTTATVSGIPSGDAFLAFSADDITSATVSAVPEPSSWALMGAGLGLLAWCRRRRA